MLHLHISSWGITIVLFLSVWFLTSLRRKQAAKILLMVLRLSYIFVLYTGFRLYLWAEASMGYHLKVLGGILVIAFMEMVLARRKKEKPTVMFWILLFVSFVVTVYLGMVLPMGYFLR